MFTVLLATKYEVALVQSFQPYEPFSSGLTSVVGSRSATMAVMGKLFGRKSQVHETSVVSDDSLVHIVIAGGSLAEWSEFEESWNHRFRELARIAVESDVRYVSIYPYGPNASDDSENLVVHDRRITIDGVQICVHASTDGRERICQALDGIGFDQVVSETLLDERLFGPAGEPDLVVVLGPAQCLPASLVWELAYSEIVFVDETWTDLSIESISAAIREYSLRHRRFGGVDA